MQSEAIETMVEVASTMAADGHYYHHIFCLILKMTDIDLMLDD